MTEPGNPEAVEPDPGHRRHWPLILAAVAVVVLIAAGATLLVLWNRAESEPVSIEEARDRADAAAAENDPSIDTVPLRPAAGIYQYRGEGTEHLDTPPLTQAQGPDIPGTVTHLEGECWRLRVDYSTKHWQSWDYCPSGTGLTETAGAFFQQLDLVVATIDTSSSYTCDPPADAIRPTQSAGDQWTHECRGTSTGTEGEVFSSGPYTFVGPQDLDIAGTTVPALHYRRLRQLSGGQSGTEDTNVWFDSETGLPLRNERTITVHSSSMIGGVTYEEEGSFQLESLEPT